MATPVRLAMIGAGIFARDAHIPAIKALDSQSVEVKAIYSRDPANARRLAEALPYEVDIPTDLEEIWGRDDIDAIDIVLPIAAMPPIIESALKSGKHVFSEKPIAPTVAAGKHLMTMVKPGQLWTIGENYRFDTNYQQTADLVNSGAIGKPLLAHYTLHMPVTPDSKYFQSNWRQQPDFPGGWLLDGGVHHIAALRMVLGEITEVSAGIANMSSDLTGVDTLVANLRFANGVLGQYSITYAAGPKRHVELTIHGEAGYIRLSPTSITIEHGDEAVQHNTQRVLTIDAEMAAFAEAIRTSGPNPNPPQEALRDLAVMEALLQSAERRQAIAIEPV